MKGEWGPTDKDASSVADDPLHLRIAYLGSGSFNIAGRAFPGQPLNACLLIQFQEPIFK